MAMAPITCPGKSELAMNKDLLVGADQRETLDVLHLMMSRLVPCLVAFLLLPLAFVECSAQSDLSFEDIVAMAKSEAAFHEYVLKSGYRVTGPTQYDCVKGRPEFIGVHYVPQRVVSHYNGFGLAPLGAPDGGLVATGGWPFDDIDSVSISWDHTTRYPNPHPTLFFHNLKVVGINEADQLEVLKFGDWLDRTKCDRHLEAFLGMPITPSLFRSNEYQVAWELYKSCVEDHARDYHWNGMEYLTGSRYDSDTIVLLRSGFCPQVKTFCNDLSSVCLEEEIHGGHVLESSHFVGERFELRSISIEYYDAYLHQYFADLLFANAQYSHNDIGGTSKSVGSDYHFSSDGCRFELSSSTLTESGASDSYRLQVKYHTPFGKDLYPKLWHQLQLTLD